MCDERYFPKHQCKGNQLCKLDVYAEDILIIHDKEVEDRIEDVV